MKRRIAFPLFLLLLGCGSAHRGSQAPARVPTDDERIRSVDNEERMAVLNRDLSALERLWSDDFTVNAPSSQVVIGRPEVMALVGRGVIHYSSFDRKIELIRFAGDIAIVMGSETVQPIGNAPLAGQTVQRRFTNIWRKDGATWRLIARHANVIPPR